MRHFENNPRKISQKELRQLRADLRELGDLGGFVHNLETDEIVGGNQRSEAIPGILSGKLTPVITQTYDPPNQQGTVSEGYFEWEGERFKYRAVRWDAATARRANIRANKAGGVWDFDTLAQWDFDELKGWGFDADFMQHMETGAAWLGEALQAAPEPEPGDAEAQLDRAAELQEVWQVQPGELFELGAHKLICGDCTDAATVARLMGGEKADLVFTDPPYGVNYEGGRNPVSNVPREKLEGDKTGDLYMPGLKTAKSVCKKHAPMYVWFADRGGKPVYDAVFAIGYEVRAMIVWNKLDAHYGNFMAQYMQKHEPCLYIVDGRSNWKGATNEVTVWDVKQPTKNENHPTEKPLELALRAIGNHDANIIFDGFLGSGTTMVAAQNLSRVCYGCEKDPKYVAVILQRFTDAFPGLEIRRYPHV